MGNAHTKHSLSIGHAVELGVASVHAEDPTPLPQQRPKASRRIQSTSSVLASTGANQSKSRFKLRRSTFLPLTSTLSLHSPPQAPVSPRSMRTTPSFNSLTITAESTCSGPTFTASHARPTLPNPTLPYAVFPIDVQELDRMDEFHYLLKHIRGDRNYSVELLKNSKFVAATLGSTLVVHSPVLINQHVSHVASATTTPTSLTISESIGDPPRVLDVGMASGIWTLEIAAEFPRCHVIGVDYAPVATLPTTVIPSNIQFLFHNILQHPFPFPDHYIDYIHVRNMLTSIPDPIWPAMLKEYHRLLVPCGFVEIIEQDPLVQSPGPVGYKINSWITSILQSKSILPDRVHNLAQHITDAGLVLVENVVDWQIPLGKWGGVIGVKNLELYSSWILALHHPLEMLSILPTGEQSLDTLQSVINDLKQEVELERSFLSVKVYIASPA